jgi:response regulator RpfG family c-di-GMP phosphodiesterase
MGVGKTKILYVDDDENNLLVFEANLKKHFDILTAYSGEDALRILESDKDIGVVVADQRMPRMTGIALLRRIKKMYPHVVKIILTAYEDHVPLMESHNSELAKKYIIKPWSKEELIEMLHQAVALYLKRKATNGEFSKPTTNVYHKNNLELVKNSCDSLTKLKDELEDFQTEVAKINGG